MLEIQFTIRRIRSFICTVLAHILTCSGCKGGVLMVCLLCKGEMKPSTTIHTVQLKNCVVVIKNVPCMKCEQCGEVVLSADTVEKI